MLIVKYMKELTLVANLTYVSTVAKDLSPNGLTKPMKGLTLGRSLYHEK